MRLAQRIRLICKECSRGVRISASRLNSFVNSFVAMLLAATISVQAVGEDFTAEQLRFFEQRVRPVSGRKLL